MISAHFLLPNAHIIILLIRPKQVKKCAKLDPVNILLIKN